VLCGSGFRVKEDGVERLFGPVHLAKKDIYGRLSCRPISSAIVFTMAVEPGWARPCKGHIIFHFVLSTVKHFPWYRLGQNSRFASALKFTANMV
jgi:hypothetical protein